MNRRPTNSKQRRDRRGAVVGLLLVSLVFLTGFAALGANIVRLQMVQSQLRAGCRAAALAGAAELLDEDGLRGPGEQGDDVAAARETACYYAARHGINGSPIRLDPNPSNDETGDIVAGWLDPIESVGGPLEFPTAEQSEVNTIRVTARLGRNVADEVTAWFGRLVGITSFDIGARAQATIDRRVAGFRPAPGVKVPVVPLVADDAAWTAAVTAGEKDDYAVDPKTGVVTAGSDGIAEMTLVCGEAATAPAVACAALNLFNEQELSYVWPVRCREGLSQGDLLAYGGELIIRNGARPVLVESTMPDDLPYGLMDIVGQVRAWPLGELQSAGECDVVAFAAARIVAVRPVDNSQNNAWEFVLQPAVLVSSQAVATTEMNPNPWIAKLELTQ